MVDNPSNHFHSFYKTNKTVMETMQNLTKQEQPRDTTHIEQLLNEFEKNNYEMAVIADVLTGYGHRLKNTNYPIESAEKGEQKPQRFDDGHLNTFDKQLILQTRIIMQLGQLKEKLSEII